MNKTLLLFLATFMVITVSGQPPDLKTRMNSNQETSLHQRKSGFEKIKNSLERLHIPKQDQRSFTRTKSEHTITQRLDSVYVNSANAGTGELEQESKFEFIYNSATQLVLETAYLWDITSGQWIFEWRDSSSYDSAGNLVESIISLWDISTEEWVNFDREEYVFDDEGNEISTILYLWDAEGEVWDSLQLNEYTYENGNQVEEIEYAWVEGEWVRERKLESQYDASGNLTEDIEYLWDGAEWVPDFRNVNTYDAEGNLTVGTFYQWDAGSESWVEEWKYEVTLDEGGNQSMLTYSQFNADTGEWEPYWRVDYTYNGNSNLAEEISYSIEGGEETPVERYEYIVNTGYTSEEILTPYGFSYILLFNNMLTSFNVFLYDGTEWIASSSTEFFYNPYEPPQYSLTIDIAGNGTVNVNETAYTEPISIAAGTEVTLEAVADENYTFLNWSGDLVSDEPEVTITMDANKVIVATFSIVDSAEGIPDNMPLVYPNPFSSSITISNTEKISFVTFVNLIGRTVKEVNLEGSGTRSIPTADLENGIYMLIFQGINGERTIMKMIKN